MKMTTQSFKEAIQNTKGLLVVDFWAEWCGPCRMIAPIIDELAAEYEGRVLVAKCDVEECEEAVAKFGVRNIPTVVFVKGGEVVDKNVGAASKDALKAKIEKLL